MLAVKNFCKQSLVVKKFMLFSSAFGGDCRSCRQFRRNSNDSHDRSQANIDLMMRFKWPRNYMPSNFPSNIFPTIADADDAKLVVSAMDEVSKKLLLQELRLIEQQAAQSNGFSEKVTVTSSQLYQVFLSNCLPFIGFGILDNGIMIVAGEYIDVNIGVVLGISTMAAAALGNLVSDVAGVGCAGYIEVLVTKLGVEAPDITLVQSQLKSVRWTVAFGRAFGISLGCLIGMIPLLFYDKTDDDVEQTTSSD